MRKALTRLLAATVLLGGITLATDASAQRGGRGGGGEGGDRFERFRESMMERLRDRFEVKDDAEWKLISERLTAVMELRRSGRGGFGAFGPGRGGPRGDRGGDRGPDAAGQGGENRDRNRDRGGRPPGGPGNEAAEALQQALDSGASTDEIKTKLAKLRESRKADEKKLKEAQGKLREVLTLKQEATAVLMGFLE